MTDSVPLSRAVTLTAGHALALGALAAVDYSLGPGTEFASLYLVAVMTCAWLAGMLPGLVMAGLASSLVLLFNDLLFSEQQTFGLLALGTVRLATYLTVAVFVAQVGEQRRELRREAAGRDDYVALVAHELRNPFVAIRAAAQTLTRHPADTERAGKLGRGIATEATAGLTLLDDLAEMTRIGTRRMTSALVPLDLAALVAETVTSFEPGDHPVERLGLPAGVRVLGDEHRLAQVIRNLLSNAAKYSPAGTPIEVTVGYGARRDTAVVTVRDHGPGIPPVDRSKLFEKFSRLSTAGETRGSGLGLYISRQIARDHNGDLIAEWPRGGGTTFSLILPFLRER